MDELTPSQKEKIEKILQEEGELGVFAYLLKSVLKMENRLEEVANQTKEVNQGPMEIAQTIAKNVLKDVKGDQGEKGEKGDTPSAEELSQAILPLIPEPIPGKDGKNGKDGRNGKDGVDGRDGADGKDGKDGVDGKDGKDGSPDTGEDIIEKINTDESEKKIKREKVEGLNEELTAIRNLPRGGGGRRVFQPFRTDLSSSCDGSNKTFYLDRAPLDDGTIMVYGTDFPVVLRPTIDFTIANKVLTLTSAVPAPSSGATLICTYFS